MPAMRKAGSRGHLGRGDRRDFVGSRLLSPRWRRISRPTAAFMRCSRVRQVVDVNEHPIVTASPVGQGVEFLRDAVIPIGQTKRLDDLFGSLP